MAHFLIQFIKYLPNAHIAESLDLFSLISKVKKVLELYGPYEFVCEKIGAFCLKKIDKISMLGVTLGYALSWNDHILTAAKAVAYKLGILFRTLFYTRATSYTV